MKPVKDNFSVQADVYARFRPRYPDALYNFLFGHVRQFMSAWDCGTGNGQVAEKLSDRFAMVYATDVSEEQLRNAVQKPNVRYALTRAERTGLPDNCVDLVTV